MGTMMNTHGHTRSASRAQLKLLSDLIMKHEVPEPFIEELRDLYRAQSLTHERISTALTLINTLPMRSSEDINVDHAVLLLHKRTLVRVSPTRDGGYRTSLYNVKTNKFEDRHVPVSILRESRTLKPEEADRFVGKTGVCGHCGFRTKAKHDCIASHSLKGATA